MTTATLVVVILVGIGVFVAGFMRAKTIALAVVDEGRTSSVKLEER